MSNQLSTGNLYGSVTDGEDRPLPGAKVTLIGGGPPQAQLTDAQGQFKFLALAPDSYVVKVELEGFSTMEYPNISIRIGRNTQILVTLSPPYDE